MLFAQIPGLAETKAHFIQTIKRNKVSHALLFDGESGGAGLPMALGFLTYLYCKEPTETDACGQCANCQKIGKLSHPDINFIFPTEGGKKVYSELLMAEWREMIVENPWATLTDWIDFLNDKGVKIKQGNIPVEESRKVIQNLGVKSYEGGYKTVVIWISETMGNGTANALLKILEEPPEDTLFILLSYNYEKNLRTIISRTQRVGIRSLENYEIRDFLINTKQIEPAKAEKAAFLADGNMRQALQNIQSNESDASAWFMNWMRLCYAFDLKKLVPLADEYAKYSKDSQKNLLLHSQKMLREICLNILGNNDLMRLEGDELEFIRKFSKAFKFENIEKMLDLINDTQYLIERNVSPKIAFMDLSLTLATLVK
jgi:DNA polymerase III subunit delta'